MKISGWLFLFLLASCKQDVELIDLNKHHILAGEVSKNMLYRDFEPDIIIDTLTVTSANGYTSINTLVIDIDNDGINDIGLIATNRSSQPFSYDHDYYSDIIPKNTATNKISINADRIYYDYGSKAHDKYFCNGIIRKANYRSAIGEQIGEWSPIDSLYKGYPLHNESYGLASSYGIGQDAYENDVNNWRNTSNKYLGIRFVQGSDTLYGWIRMSVIGYTRIILHDCAFEKK